VELCQSLETDIALAGLAGPWAEQANDMLIDLIKGLIAVKQAQKVLGLLQQAALELLPDDQTGHGLLVPIQTRADPFFGLGAVNDLRNLD